jgi:HD superfamily phosphohydrolase
MEIRDVIHGSIPIDAIELPVLDSKYFQRLRQIKQLGFAEYSFPSATHNRYIHSLGAMCVASKAYDSIFGNQFPKFKATVRLAALLHDIGHAPLSHTTEFAMPNVHELNLHPKSLPSRQANHEDFTLKIILNSDLSKIIETSGKEFGITPNHIAGLIDPAFKPKDTFFLEKLDGVQVDFFPILKQLISSELDADRMDYLRRDSLNSGVSYGQFDADWIISNLTYYISNGKCYLALQHRALYSFEDFLISRFHMFLMVYFHYKSVIYDEMLFQYFNSPDCNYKLPADIEEYCKINDAHLHTHLANSTNPWAQRISAKKPYRMLVELHSGIPATKMAHSEQDRLKTEIETDLKKQGIHFLEATSTGELSKYFRKPGDPIYVRYDNHYSTPSYIPLEQCTDLFQKYSQNRSITRFYVSPEDNLILKKQGRGAPLKYEEVRITST